MTILNMAKNLKANAKNQRSEIGGGHYGYLPLIIPKTDFLTLPNAAAVVFLIAPAPFNIIASTTAVQWMVQKRYGKLKLRHI